MIITNLWCIRGAAILGLKNASKNRLFIDQVRIPSSLLKRFFSFLKQRKIIKDFNLLNNLTERHYVTEQLWNRWKSSRVSVREDNNLLH
jgi:hypothetical protein